MDSQNLLAFIQVADCASFSLAAEKLHLTQPAVSKRITALEDHLKLKLFDRIGRKVNLTEAGRVLLPNAQKILRELQETRRRLADLSGQVRGTLQLATSHHIGLHRLPPVLKQFSQLYPEVDLQLSFLDSETAHDRVLHGLLDLAVITLSPDSHPALKSQTIWEDELCFVASPTHPLAGKKRPRLAQLAEYPAVLPELSTYTGRIVAEIFSREDIALPLKLTTNYLETLKMLVSIDLGWSVLPRSMVDEQLVALSPQGASLKRQLGLVYHRERNLGNAAHAFIGLLSPKPSTNF